MLADIVKKAETADADMCHVRCVKKWLKLFIWSLWVAVRHTVFFLDLWQKNVKHLK